MTEIKGTFFDRPPSAFDPVQGYRLIQPGFRAVRVINGEIVYDTFFHTNSARNGWIVGVKLGYYATERVPLAR